MNNFIGQNFFKEINIERILIFFFSAFFLADFMTSFISFYFDYVFFRIAALFKFFFQILLTYLIIKNWDRVDKKLFIVTLLLFFCFLFGSFSTWNTDSTNLNTQIFSGNIYYFDKYLFIFLFVLAVNSISIELKTFNVILRNFKLIMLINSVSIIIGLFTNLDFLRSFPFSERFGYKGLFSVAGLALHSYIILIVFLYHNYFITKKNKHFIELFIIIIVSLLIGKKTMLLFLLFLLLYHLCFVDKNKLVFRKLSIVFGVVGLFFREIILTRVLSFFHGDIVFNTNKTIYFVTSSRNELFIDAIDYISENWNLLNYFFGGIDYKALKVEFEFVDVFLFFGATGLILFIYLFYKYFYKKSNNYGKSYFIIILASSFFSGGFLIDVTFVMLFYILILFIVSNKMVNE